MAWVVKEWRMEAVARSLVQRAREAAEAIRFDAERDVRRARRNARREIADAAEYLTVLERMASDLQTTVRRQREAVRTTVIARDNRQPHAGERRRRGGRASLRTRAVAELFAATEAPPAQ